MSQSAKSYLCAMERKGSISVVFGLQTLHIRVRVACSTKAVVELTVSLSSELLYFQDTGRSNSC